MEDAQPAGQRPDRSADRPEELQTHEIGNRTYIVADVDPLDVDGVRTIAVGTALWLAAFVMLLPFYGRLEDGERVWWLWTCLAGFGLGVIGWDYCRRRRNLRGADPGADPDTRPGGAA
ncbi:MAG: DUF2530 domain-containing protein [Nocardioides sp.]|nr:DUF2530 domain-containing protein [Nocardioides sp.]